MVKDIRKTIKDEGVGKARHDTYQGVLAQYSKAMKEGFYLEAITLIESIIADRLESITNQLSDTNEYSYGTLGYLITGVRKLEISSKMSSIVDDIDEWRKSRNAALHEMAKFDREDFEKPFDVRYAEFKQDAENGITLFRELDKEIRNYRNNLKSKKQ